MRWSIAAGSIWVGTGWYMALRSWRVLRSGDARSAVRTEQRDDATWWAARGTTLLERCRPAALQPGRRTVPLEAINGRFY
jgi:hypothetical protein